MICKWCNGTGSISVDGGSQRYRCPDCAGTGRVALPDDDRDPEEVECDDGEDDE